MTTDFCLDAVREAIHRYGCPEIFNTDQGCQFTSGEFTGLLKAHDIRISMDGKGSWRDNVFVERLWKSVQYEEVYLKAGLDHHSGQGQVLSVEKGVAGPSKSRTLGSANSPREKEDARRSCRD